MSAQDYSKSFPRLGYGGAEIINSKASFLGSGTLKWDKHLSLLGSAEPYFGSIHHLKRQLAETEIYGRGGAAFPLSKKIEAYQRFSGNVVIVANGSESEFLSRKDAALLTRHPHLVLDGLTILATSLGATAGYIHLKYGNSDLQAIVSAALVERNGFDPIRIELSVSNPSVGYPSGVESAVISAVDGSGGKPIYLPDRPIVKGIKRRPTLVSNVETLAQLALLARFGAEWFSGIGSSSEFGSRLLTITNSVGTAAVVEVASGINLSELLNALSINLENNNSVLIGGYFGRLVHPMQLKDLTVSAPAFKDLGLGLGAGVIAVSTCCPLMDTSRIIEYLASQSSGQCGPCFNGLPALAVLWNALSRPSSSPDIVNEITRVSALVMGRGGCAMPDGAVILSKSSLAYFKSEVIVHQQGGCSFPTADSYLVPSGMHRGFR